MGACADCWQSKLHGGESAITPREPRTEPFGLLDFLDDVPDVVWILVLVPALAVAARVVAGVPS